MKPSNREQIEASLTFARTVELLADPVQGSFDADHLKEINRRLFQDLPSAGFEDVTPGIYRPPVPDGQDWLKARGASAKGQIFVAYSRMDNAALERLASVLKTTAPSSLLDLKLPEVAKAIATLYTELDYVHPFSDGNSRTLRIFTHQFAKEGGWFLDWAFLGQTDEDRDLLYWARDRSVNTLALPHVSTEATMKRLIRAQHAIPESPKLHELLGSALSPRRAGGPDSL